MTEAIPRPATVAAVYDRRTDSPARSSAVIDRRYRPLTSFSRLPAQTLLAFIRLYQRTLSPVLPAVFGPGCGCRFAPTCSHYAADAIRTHGALAGSWLAARRLVKCTPLHAGGFDPVPPPRRLAPQCARVAT